MQRAGILPACCVLWLLAFGMASAQMTTSTEKKKKNDSTFVAREIVKPDSLAVPLATLGAMQLGQAVSKSALRSLRYNTMWEALARATSLPIYSLGGFGQAGSLSIYGGLPDDLTVGMNGRPLTDAWSGRTLLALHSPEGFENMELLHGSAALGTSPLPTLTHVNLQSIRHNTATPYIRLWYTQGTGDMLATDVTLSQNVAAPLNVTVGLRRAGANGVYERTGFDVWNGRISARYTASWNTHAELRFDVASLNGQQWGGLDPTQSMAGITETTALPRYLGLADNIRRTDATLTATHLFDRDTNLSMTATMWGTKYDMLRLRDTTIGGLPYVVRSSSLGAVARADARMGVFRIRAGAAVDSWQADAFEATSELNEVRVHMFGYATLELAPALTVRGAARFDTWDGRGRIGGGGGMLWVVDSMMNVDVDVSTADVQPSASMQNAASTRELLAVASFTHRGGLNVSGFVRRMEWASATIAGAYVRQPVRIQGVEVTPTIQLHRELDNGTTYLPAVSGTLDAHYTYKLAVNSVSLGVFGRLMSPFAGPAYNPQTYVWSAGSGEQPWLTNGLDVYLHAVVGNASVHIAFENIFAQRWRTSNNYPEATRNLRIQFHWTFLD